MVKNVEGTTVPINVWVEKTNNRGVCNGRRRHAAPICNLLTAAFLFQVQQEEHNWVHHFISVTGNTLNAVVKLKNYSPDVDYTIYKEIITDEGMKEWMFIGVEYLLINVMRSINIFITDIYEKKKKKC